MNVHISYKIRKTPDIEKEIQHHIGKLRKRLQVFRPELIHLKGVVEENSRPDAFVVSLNLRLPSGQMAAQRSAPTAEAALKAGFDDLLQQMTRHKDLLRNTHKWTRRGAERARPFSQVPFEQTMAAVQAPLASAEDIRSFVNVNLGRLERFVERELYFRESAEQISTGAATKDEVVDEAVARALGNGEEKPERLALEPWLYRLALRSMDDLGHEQEGGLPDVHLEEPVRRPNVRASDEPQLQFHQPDESFTEETVIADRRTSTPEDIAYSDEMVRLVQSALGTVSRVDREAFVLHALEGFSVEEVAAVTDRHPEQVRGSISAAREHLRQSPWLASLPAADSKETRRQGAGVR